MTVAFGLVLTQIEYGDAGSYVCKASNINGEASNRTVVTVVGKLVFFHHLGLVARKPVFGVSDKASFKPVSSATETS